MPEETLVEDLAEYAASRRDGFSEASENVTLSEALQKYDLVSANYDPVYGSFVVMTDRSSRENLELGELGYASPSPWTSWARDERVPELRDKLGLRMYFDMKRADGTVRGSLRLLKTPVLAAKWYVEPYSDSALDKNIAKFVENNLFNELSVPWSRFVEDALLMCDFGYMAFEKVWGYEDELEDVPGFESEIYDKRRSKKIILKKLGPRHPLDIQEWLWDEHGGPESFIMEPVSITGQDRFDFYRKNNTDDPLNRVIIPMRKALVFTLEQEAGDLRGLSILRSAYKHYYIKDTLYKIDAIQKERHGIGVPLIKLPPGFSPTDKKLAEDLGRNLRTNERAHIAVPMNWEVSFAKLEGQPVDCIGSISHHDMKLKTNIVAPFLDEPDVNPDSLDIYYKTTRYIATTICDTVNFYLIPQLVDMNFQRGGYPKLCVRRIGEEEALRTMSFAFRNFVGAGAIRPDDPLEKFLRSLLDLPAADPETTRETQTPQNPLSKQASPGLPRQSTSPPVGTGKSNVGTDKSGGK